MDARPHLNTAITRRGLIVGAGLIAAPFIVKSRPASIKPVSVRTDRQFPMTDLLLSPASLYASLIVERRPIKLLDVSPPANYRDAHIPGAIHAWWQDTMELNATWYGMVLKPDDNKGNQRRRVRYLERLGIDQTSEIVVSSSDSLQQAARVCWFLRFLGYRAAVLDGGLAGWLGIPQSATDEVPDFAESSNPSVTPRDGFYLFASEAAPLLGTSGVQFLDLRNESERSAGKFRDVTIPGALDLPRNAVTDASGLVLNQASLSQLITSVGIDLASYLVLIAPTGLDTAAVWLALTLMGAAKVSIVDGGWGQWLGNPNAPRTTA